MTGQATETENREYSFAWRDSIQLINRSQWNALAMQLPTPFLEWDWLRLLEVSGSAAPSTGWHHKHLTVHKYGRLVAAAPLFSKTHSEGEFVFDHFWAQLAARMNLVYYPKLVGMSPFTPIGAYRFLLAPDLDQGRLINLVQGEIDRFCRALDISGCHYQFLDPAWGDKLQDMGFRSWIHPGFIWENQGFVSFDDFLACFRSSRRKNIKKERKSLAQQGIRIEALSGDEIQERHLYWMYRFYLHTNQRYFPWSCKYLTQEFFLGLAQGLKRYLLLLAAYEKGSEQPLGMSMLVFKGDQLFGRYWGGVDGVPFLHFNLCYYEPIEWAIQNGIQRFDPGMGGEHKLYRGFKLEPNYSLHKMYTPELQHVLSMYLQELNAMEKRRMLELNQGLPLK
ncbi:MAG: GNAT family N-acetyltransferase [Desulfohalobiaceae bacterium]